MFIRVHVCVPVRGRESVCVFVCERKREDTREAAKESEYDRKITLICIYAYICSDANTRRDAHRQKAQYWAQQNQGIQEGLLDPMHTFASPRRVQVCVYMCVRVYVCVWIGEWGWVWVRESECVYVSVFMSVPMQTFASPRRVQVCVYMCVCVYVCVWIGEWGWVWVREGECVYASVFMSVPMHTFASPHRVQVMMISKAYIGSDQYSMVQRVIGKDDKRSMGWLRLVGS